MKSLTFLSGTIIGSIVATSILHDGFRETSKKFISTIAEQVNKQIDETTKATEKQSTNTTAED